jgi:lipopolysaccharide export system protein LptA
MNFIRKALHIAVIVLFALPLAAQDNLSEEDVFRLVDAASAQQFEDFGMKFRRVLGNPARFLHNNTFLLCDSAIWNVSAKFVEAFGNVRIVQDGTMLSSESAMYHIEQNMVRFNGPLVELVDKEGNTLRSDRMAYNTKDSVATYETGGAMKNREGSVIESRRGTYDSKIKTFTFDGEVELYTDTIFMKSTIMRYLTDEEKMYFGPETYTWRGDGFIKSDAGWYDNAGGIIHFALDVYMNNDDYEAWCDEVYYHRETGRTEMYNNIQILNEKDYMTLLGNKLIYTSDTVATVTDRPAIAYYGENENHIVDSLFFGADTLHLYTVKRNYIPQETIDEAEARKKSILFDALTELRNKQAAERAKAAEKKMREMGKLPPDIPQKDSSAVSPILDSLGQSVQDSLALQANSTAAMRVRDTLSSRKSLKDINQENTLVHIPKPPVGFQDSTVAYTQQPPSELPDSTMAHTQQPPSELPDSTMTHMQEPFSELPDSTALKNIIAYRNVRVWRSDMQMRCDSLFFTELDSIAQLFGRPILWNKIKNQLTSDKMQLMLKDGNLYRGSMLDNAMITTQEDTLYYNQIKGAEMMGFFRENQLYRYDALGSVYAIFYVVEEQTITTVNVKEAESMTAVIKDGNAERLIYLSQIKSDAYPVGDLEIEKQRLKGFEWRGEERPVDRFDITSQPIFVSQRDRYTHITRPDYRYSNRYYDGHMRKVITDINTRAERERQRELDLAREEARRELDSLKAGALLRDSLLIDTLLRDTLHLEHSLRDTLLNTHNSELNTPQPDTILIREISQDTTGIVASVADSVQAVIPVRKEEEQQVEEEKSPSLLLDTLDTQNSKLGTPPIDTTQYSEIKIQDSDKAVARAERKALRKARWKERFEQWKLRRQERREAAELRRALRKAKVKK